MKNPRYDNKEYRYRHTDPSNSGRKLVAQLLGLQAQPTDQDLKFDLSFFSGGMGVLDKYHISITADAGVWSTVTAHLNAKTPKQLADEEYGGRVERAIVFHIHAWDVNCPQHIKPRFTEEDLAPMVEQCQRRIGELEAEVHRLRHSRGGRNFELIKSLSD